MITWKGFVAFAAALLVASAVLPPQPGAVLRQLVMLLCAAALWRAAMRAPDRRPWLALAIAVSTFLAGHVVLMVQAATGAVPSFPGPADALYYVGYIGLVGHAVLLHRHRRPKGASGDFVDSLIVAAGFGLVVWTFFMAPYADTAGLPMPARVTAAGYSVFTLSLVAIATRIAVGAGARNVSYHLLATSFVAILVADVVTTMSTVNPALAPIAAYAAAACFILVSAAAMHPSMAQLTAPAQPRPALLTRRRLRLLVLALAMGPAVLVVQRATGRPVQTAVVVFGGFALCGLVLARMALLVRLTERRAARERALRAASERLVAATSKYEMHRGALSAALALIGSPGARVTLATADAGRVVVVASSGPGSEFLEGRDLTLDVDRHVEAREGAAVDGGTDTSVASTLVPLISHNTVRGVLVATTGRPLDDETTGSLADLAADVSLALESAAAAERLHRERVERRFRALIENSTDLVAVTDATGRFTYVSAAARRMLGFGTDQLVGRLAVDFVHDDDREIVDAHFRTVRDDGGRAPVVAEVRAAHADGTWRTLEVIATDLLGDPDVNGLVLNARDVTERKHLEEELRHQALHDSLTGLANRALFADRVEHALTKRPDRDDGVCVLFVDVDDFKTVNDSLGHAAGDELLVGVADRLRSVLRVGDTAARLGGDEFGILVDDARSTDEMTFVAERLLAVLQEPFTLDGREVHLSASIGIAFNDDRAVSATILLRNADVAMYLAKERGKARYELFEESMHLVAFQRLELKGDLSRAVEESEFHLLYQPIVDLDSGELVSAEALVRWQHPTRGLVGPDQFIPIAEETGLIVPLGRWVLREACAQLARWRESLGAAAPRTVSVNVSVRQLERDDLLSDILDAVAAAGLQPSDLTVELTESIIMGDTELSRRRLAAIKAAGVSLAIDDFGSGYSSLGYLQRFPVDVLKIDRSFVEGLVAPENDGGVMRAIVDLAAVLDLVLVAEGIEVVEQLNRLGELGCHRGQGFLISRPVDADHLAVFAVGRARLLEGAPVS